MIIGVLCVAAIGAIFVLAFVELPDSVSYDYNDFEPAYNRAYEAIKLDRQKAFEANKIEECKTPPPVPVGRKFR